MNYPIILARNLTKNPQNRHFCALLPSETPVFGLFEHKIGVFVRFCQQVSSRCCRSSSLQGTQCRVSRGAATLPHRLPLRSMDCRCSDIANLSAHLHRLPTPPAYLRRMRLQPGRRVGVRWQMMLPHRGSRCVCNVEDAAAPLGYSTGCCRKQSAIRCCRKRSAANCRRCK